MWHPKANLETGDHSLNLGGERGRRGLIVGSSNGESFGDPDKTHFAGAVKLKARLT